MIINIAREELITPKVWGNSNEPQPFRIRIKVPTAVEVEQLLAEKASDSKIFSRFMIGSENLVDENGKEITSAAAIVAASGTYPLVTEVAGKILNLAMLGDDEKNE
jgi:hypothetical protein